MMKCEMTKCGACRVTYQPRVKLIFEFCDGVADGCFHIFPEIFNIFLGNVPFIFTRIGDLNEFCIGFLQFFYASSRAANADLTQLPPFVT